ncbi:Lipoyltransferase and lipoate-protein ligase [Thelephora ganbajun]|uniref:Lipoyltransferase and lipoate-protein ligase n=1 Tax=Thelephora ganbajun TaxID=370292 RepID=A0ACB6Z4M9_THEGA|nr:Lipoyltransferase and lipoate-protein ligase [Thelephora ganbajun]
MISSVFHRVTRTRLALHYAHLLSTSATQVVKHSIYVSKSTNPYFNLSLEDWLFKHKPHNDPLLLLYRDDPCVVIGRNQNPWKEVNMTELRGVGIPFIRRRSGGGTVYHDLGNSNFSIHLPRSSFDRNDSAKVVLRAIQSLGLTDANVNERNDVCVGRFKICFPHFERMIVNKRAYHHGTMLISSELGTLGKLLNSNKDTMQTKGVASVRSPVCNLRQHKPDISHEDFVYAVVREFQDHYNIRETIKWVDEGSDCEGIEEIRKGMHELTTWDWAFGQTPEFTYTLEHTFGWGTLKTNLHSKHGIILSCTFDIVDLVDRGGISEVRGHLDLLERSLAGEKYGFLEDEANPKELTGSESARQLWDELVKEMKS